MRRSISSGPLARFFSVLTVATLVGCASGPSGEARLRPGPQRLPHLRAQGDLIIATLEGVAITVQALTPTDLDAYYSRRPALANPFKGVGTATAGPLAFVIRIQNQGRERITFDPSQSQLVDQRDHRVNAITYDELHGVFSEGDQSAKALQSLQETVLTNFLVVPPRLDREGLLLFPPPNPDAKTVILRLDSLYVGSAVQLLLFEFEVKRTP